MLSGGQVGRWLLVIGALCVAGLAIYVLTSGGSGTTSRESKRPAMDHIDEESREAMRDLLRDVDSGSPDED